MYAETLKQLASDADAAEQAEDLATSASLWRDALVLLPPDSRQHAAISERITALSRRGSEICFTHAGVLW